jgi:hypothetical protein
MRPDTEHEGKASKAAPKKGAKLSDDDLYRKLKRDFLQDAKLCVEWHKQARNDFDFKAGEQWGETTKQTMGADGAGPPIVFNMSLAVVQAVAGIEINGRHETTYLPRGTEEGDIIANEVLSGASQWMADECDAEDEQSSAFEDAIDCGLGWTETRIDWDEEPDGKYIEESVSPLEMFWDHRARKKNLADARRVWRARKMTRGDARDLIEGLGVTVGIGPGAAVGDEDLHCPWAVGEDIKAPESVDKRRLKLGDDSYRVDDDELVTILHGQWLDYEPFFLTVGADGSEVEMAPDDFKEYRKAYKKATGQDVPHVRQRRQVRRQAFIGGKVLFKGDLCRKGPDGETRYMDRFTFNCITGHLNKTKGTWFGLITVLRDPQMLVNKTLSKVIHILSTTAQGGVLAEKGAFGADIGQAQRTYAKHNKITEVADGAIREGRIMAKPGAGNIAPFASILEYAVDSLWRVAGTSPELLGTKDVNQPGVLEAQRKQSSMTILAKLFDSLRRFRKNVGRNRLYYIQNFLSDGRIVRITGETGKKAVRLIRENTTGQYDVIVDDAPTSPNQKEQTFQLLMQLMPFFKDKMTAEAAMVFLEHSPLPAKVVAQFKEMLLKPNPQAQAQSQIELRGQAAEVAKTEAETEKIRSETREKEQAARANAVMDMANVAVSQAKVRQANIAADHTGAKAARDMQNWQREDEERAAEAAMMPTVPELPEVGTQPVAQPSGQPVPVV